MIVFSVNQSLTDVTGSTFQGVIFFCSLRILSSGKYAITVSVSSRFSRLTVIVLRMLLAHT